MTEDMRLISGIPAWTQMYFERLLARTGKRNVKEVFPQFSLFVYGGVNYAPYRDRMRTLIGGEVDSIALFPASEGFIAYQDRHDEEGPVSYTHLRAHETVLDLVCRLLLENKQIATQETQTEILPSQKKR